jgi:hypothetical protein
MKPENHVRLGEILFQGIICDSEGEQEAAKS